MYRVLIVDDEEPVLDSFEFLIEESSSSFRVSGKARTGYEAVRLIHELHPDVVFMDINIPGMDGIQVIEEVHEQFPDTIFILSTAYERFDLAQRALPLGVFLYLVKPISKKTFLTTLDSVRLHLDKKQPVLPQKTTNLLEQQFLTEVIWKPMTKDEWEHYKEAFSFHSDKAVVCLIEIEKDSVHWGQEIARKLSFHHRCLSAFYMNRMVYLIPEALEAVSFKRELQTLIQQTIPDSLYRVFGIGSVHGGKDVHLSCSEAVEDLRAKKNNLDVLVRERSRIVQIRRKIGIAPEEEVTALFHKFWEEVFGYYSFDLAKAKMIAFFTLLVDDCSGYYQDQEDANPPLLPVEEILPLQNLPEWTRWSTDAFQKLYERFALHRKGNFPLPLVKALTFINEHYNEPLQLTTVAEEVRVSVAYLSRLFTEHVHANFIDYLTKMRMEKAETLIRDSKLSIKEIAYLVGYQDPNYFSKLFKKIMGVSPSLYTEVQGKRYE